MEQKTSQWTVKMLVDLRGRIDLEAEYQRGDVWSVPQKRLLMDSILRGYDIPKIYLRKLPQGSSRLYEMVDGKQRTTALWEFFDNAYRLAKSLEVSGLGELGGKSYSELSEAARDGLTFAQVTVSEILDASDDEIEELFLRLQKGEPLRAAEKRNAISGPVRDFVRDVLANHSVFPNLGLPSKRYGWHEAGAIALILALNEGPTSLKGADLSALYEASDFDPHGDTATRTVHLLDQMNEIALVAPGTIRTRWGFVDLFVTLMMLEKEGEHPDPKVVMDFFTDFEDERLKSQRLLDGLRTEVTEVAAQGGEPSVIEMPDLKRDMYVYVSAFSREGATEKSVRERTNVMHSRLHRIVTAGADD